MTSVIELTSSHPLMPGLTWLPGMQLAGTYSFYLVMPLVILFRMVLLPFPSSGSSKAKSKKH